MPWRVSEASRVLLHAAHMSCLSTDHPDPFFRAPSSHLPQAVLALAEVPARLAEGRQLGAGYAFDSQRCLRRLGGVLSSQSQAVQARRVFLFVLLFPLPRIASKTRLAHTAFDRCMPAQRESLMIILMMRLTPAAGAASLAGRSQRGGIPRGLPPGGRHSAQSAAQRAAPLQRAAGACSRQG